MLMAPSHKVLNKLTAVTENGLFACSNHFAVLKLYRLTDEAFRALAFQARESIRPLELNANVEVAPITNLAMFLDAIKLVGRANLQ
mgnify:CR=1 FL=1